MQAITLEPMAKVGSSLLIYAPELEGHPRVYCRVICDAISKGSCRIVLALGENNRATIANSVDLLPLFSRDDITFIKTNDVSRSGNNDLTAEELRNLQLEQNAGRTLLIEAEKFSYQFVRIAVGQAPKLSGCTFGIFARTAEWYPGEEPSTGKPKRLIEHSLRRSLGNIKRALLNRKDAPAYFYEHILMKRSCIDFVITKDERLASRGFPRVVWMPEISRIHVDADSSAPTNEDRQRQRELLAFKNSHSCRTLLLYFGDAAFYKGYDLFLELLNRHGELVGVHAGRIADDNQRHMYEHNTVSLRKQLVESGRLLETNKYVSSEYQKKLYFSEIDIYATTHRLTLSSSTMMQAAELGKPLLVPNRGLLGYRVNVNQLGETYRYGDIDDLYRKLIEMKSQPLGRFAPALKRFSDLHSCDRVDAFWRKLLLNEAVN
jgi:hypothetical protein